MMNKTKASVLRAIRLALAAAAMSVLVHALPASAGTAIVALRDSSGARGAAETASVAARAAGASVETVFEALSRSSDGEVFAVFTNDALSDEELAEMLSDDPNVLAASPNRTVRAMIVSPTDPGLTDGDQWGMEAIGLGAGSPTWNETNGGEGVYVAVIDTGVDADHPDLAANLEMKYAKNFIDTRPMSDGKGHGTHVAGIVAALANGSGTVGAAPRAKIIPIKTLGDSGEGTTKDMIKGLDYVAELIDKGVNVVAANLSLGGYMSQPPALASSGAEYRAMKALSGKGALLVVAAGNEGSEVGAPLTRAVEGGERGDYSFPSSFTGIENMIVVGAIDSHGAAPSFTNWSGRAVDVCAPGVGILSTIPGGRYSEKNGTSMATPFVSAEAALIKAKDPSLSASDIKARIIATASTSVPRNDSVSIAPQFSSDRSVGTRGMISVSGALASDAADAADALKASEITGIEIKPSGSTPRDSDGAFVVAAGRMIAFAAEIEPRDAWNRDIDWESSNPSVARVDGGVVYGVREGKCVITAKRASDGALERRVQIRVEKGAPPSTGGGGGGGCAAGSLALLALAAFLTYRRMVL